MSSIAVVLRPEPEEKEPEPVVVPEQWNPLKIAGDSLKDLGKSMQNVVNGLIRFGLYTLPLLLLYLLPLGLVGLATIAAYNGGANSVIRSFTGKFTKRHYPSRYSWRRHAFKKINKLSADELYNHLRAYLPARETRNYLKKVRNRMEKYST